MKIKLININKTKESWISAGIENYRNRICRYVVFDELVVKATTRNSNDRVKVLEEEADKILSLIKKDDYLVLLDERGGVMDSAGFSVWLNKKSVSLRGDLVFVIGGAFGFHSRVVEAASERIALSSMTFTHQMVRLIFMEQLYRAFTILKNEPYHHA